MAARNYYEEHIASEEARMEAYRQTHAWTGPPKIDLYEDEDYEDEAGFSGSDRAKKKKTHPVKIFFRVFFLLLLTSMLVIGLFAAIRIHTIISEAPQLNTAALSPTMSATYICNSEGNRIQKLTLPEANRDIVTIEQIPIELQHAFVAIEDSRYYRHNGIDLPGILRAFISGVRSGHFSEGASTITQQLLKNSIFTDWTSEKSFEERLTRKIQEQYLALQLEKIMTKDQILEDYLNMINLGAGCYGVASAAYRYFGKDVSDLTLSECAVIAGITQNPTRYNPITNPDNNAARRQTVLSYMLKQGYITDKEYGIALADNVYERIRYHEDSIDVSSSVYTYYQDALIDQVMQDLITRKGYTYKQAYQAVYSGGLRIYSAQDDALQKICDEEFANLSNFPDGTEVGLDYALSVQHEDTQITHYGNDDIRKYVRANINPAYDLMSDTVEEASAYAEAFRKYIVADTDTVLGERITITPQPQASVVVMDQSTGLVKAIVGGRGSKDASLTLNRATYTTRQPGSTFKILTTYAPALDVGGKTLTSKYDNGEYYYEDGTKVSNWDLGSASGPTSIRDAIIRSVNVVAVECLTELTPEVGYTYAESFGISTLTRGYDNGTEILTDVVQPLALGGITNGVTNVDLCGAYACIANAGHYITPRFYLRVEDAKGNLILGEEDVDTRDVIKESTAYLLTDAMKGVISDPEGTAYDVIDLQGMPVCGKTGTTSDYRDIWFAGYTPYYTCCVWGGYDNNDQLPDTGIYHTYHKVLWNSIMNRIHESLPPRNFSQPFTVTNMTVCKDTGMAAAQGCSSYEEVFASGTAPLFYCNVHGNGGLFNTLQTAETDASLSGSQSQGAASAGTPILGEGDITIFSDDNVQTFTYDPGTSQNGQTYTDPNAGQSGQTYTDPNAGQSGQIYTDPNTGQQYDFGTPEIVIFN